MARGLAVALALPLLAAALSGCTALQDLQRAVDRAQGRPEFVEVERLNEDLAFAPTDAPSPPPAIGRRTVLNFTVPAGATALRAEVTVTFENPAPVPFPSGAPQGRVVANLIAPGEASGANVTFDESGAETFSVDGPEAGEWGVVLDTFGQGRVFVLAFTTEARR